MRRQQIDASKIRKHSHIVEKHQDPVAVAGNRRQTDFGFVIDGFKSKAFETLYICVVSAGVTPKWQHEKKTRVIRVVGGVGHYETFSEAGEVTVKPITFGDEVVIEPATTYRLRSGPAKLELFVTQEAKYESSLKELAPAESVAIVAAEDLASVSQEDKTHQTNIVLGTDRSMRRNRAREQLAAQRGNKPSEGPRHVGADEKDFFRNGANGGLNAMPVMSFNGDDAG